MPANLKPKAWNLKPQMTAAPELWPMCVGFFPLWEGSGYPRELVNRSAAGSRVGSPSWGGPGYVLIDGTEGWRSNPDPSLAFSTSDTIALFCRFRMEDTSGASNAVNQTPAAWFTVAEDDGMALEVDLSGNVFVTTLGGNTLGETTKPVDDNEWHNVLALWDQGGTNMTIDIDGAEQYSVNYTDTSSGERLHIGRTVSGSTIITRVALVGAFKGRMSAEARKTLGTDPFAMLRPAGF